MARAETCTLELARRCGLTVPEVRYRKVGRRPVMLIRRFDRIWTASSQAMPEGALHDTRPANGLTEGLVEGRLPFVSGLTLVACSEFESPQKAYADLGRAIRAVAKEKQGARLMGIDVDHVYAMCFGLGLACLGAAACFLMPAYYVNPTVGSGFVLVAFTIVVLGGMGSFAGALLGGLLIGVVESLGGLYLGESLGQVGIFLIFILVLLLRPQGLFGAKA